jgi:hypothetical protein
MARGMPHASALTGHAPASKIYSQSREGQMAGSLVAEDDDNDQEPIGAARELGMTTTGNDRRSCRGG